MKKLLKNIQERLQKGAKANAGFSLVELIIVIAIMAILVGIVGTQVIPYLNRSRVAKDQQLLNSYCTAAVSAYSSNADDITDSGTITVYVYGESGSNTSTDQKLLAAAIQEYVSYSGVSDLQSVMSSTDGKTVADVIITYDFDGNTCTAKFDTDESAIEDVESAL